jgi:defect-in-organelle-trafficking protein DotC
MLAQAMDRLNRDFSGIARFHRFVLTGKVSLPAVAYQDIPLTLGDGVMAVDETLLRITTLPEFNAQMLKWRSPVVISKSAPDAAVQVENAAPQSGGDK